MKFQLTRLSEYTKENISKEIKKVDDLLKKPIITQKDVIKNSAIGSRDAIINVFGTFENALKHAGLHEKFSGIKATEKQIQKPGNKMSKQEVIKELQRIAKTLNTDTLRVEDINTNSILISASTIKNKFGTFPKGIQEAGLKVSNTGVRYTEQKCFDNLQEVWEKLFRQPCYREMNSNISKVGGKAYTKRWGTWLKALESFIEYIKSDNDRSNEEISIDDSSNKCSEKSKIDSENRREIRDKLRLQVFMGDSFRCVFCGRSPANERGVILHVDHIHPFSKGGKTKLDNLQTLCEKCNLGKGTTII